MPDGGEARAEALRGSSTPDGAILPSPERFISGKSTLWQPRLPTQQVALDWLEPASAPASAPVLLLLHTMSGTSREFAPVAAEAVRRGWRAAVLLRRGHLGSPLTVPRIHLAGHTPDTKAMVAAAAARFPRAPLLALGSSAGSMALMRYLGEAGADSPIIASVCVGGPGYDNGPRKCAARFHPLLDKIIVEYIKRFFFRRQNRPALEQLASFAALRAARTLAEFQGLGYELEGYGSAEEMFEATNPIPMAGCSRTPLLCISARDDPMVPIVSVRECEWLFEGDETRSILCLAARAGLAHRLLRGPAAAREAAVERQGGVRIF